MLRHFATALLFALVTIAASTAIFNLIVDLPARASARASESAPVAEPSPPQTYGRVRTVAAAAADPIKLFMDVSRVAIEFGALRALQREEKRVATIDSLLLRPAFDPNLYRGGKVGEPLSADEICGVVEEVAAEFDLPAPLFTRLIWQESRFRNETVSRAGAQGIAQFMPGTAEERGLDDPFDPLQALPASADFLRELSEEFGNFGLAAAAYNGGPNRVKRWLAGRARLPKETRDYVLRITGRHAEYWRKAKAKPHPAAFKVKDCKVQPIPLRTANSG
jgi:soluble lytic murein transglycosylase-like protein